MISSQQGDQLAHQRDLRRKVLGLRVATGFVVGVELVAKGLAARVEDHDHRVGLLLAEHLGEHVHEAVGGVGWKAAGSAQPRDGEEGTVEGVGAVDEDDLRRSTRLRRH